MKWFYKATQSKIDYEATRALADEHAFLVRSAHNDDGAWAPNVRYVAQGDEIHMYYVGGGSAREIGAYEVIDPMEHPTPSLFGGRVPETALVNVEEPEFIAAVDASGVYKPDQVTRKFTGWPLRRIGSPSAYDTSMFPGEMTLVQAGRASAAKLFSAEDEAFENWCKANLSAFYANLRGAPEAVTDSTYFIVHRASCRIGAGRTEPETPHPRTGFNPKIAANRIDDLLVWAAEWRPKAFPVQRCKSCVPLDDLQRELEPTADHDLFQRRLQILMRTDLPERPAGNTTPERKATEGGLRYFRDPKVAAWVLKRAAGRCELCQEEAPFRRSDGGLFLEVHHISWLAKHGADTTENAAGVCPNCHRRLHHSHDATECASRLRTTVSERDALARGALNEQR